MATKIINQQSGKNWTLYNGDCVEVLAALPAASIDYSIYSPPFDSLYVYSNSERDMGNSRTKEQFEKHYRFMAREMFRVLKPGRLISFHCMLLPKSKSHDGEIGLRDFRGDLIRWHEAEGMVHHSEVVIWKDPVTAMQRTKALGLLHKQVKKDSCRSRQGIPDYLITMRKPGDNPSPVDGPFRNYVGEDVLPNPPAEPNDSYSIQVWQRYASPVWMDINPSRTLQREGAREHNDERHICPLQLQVIERALPLWTNPGDVVLSPFAGIGSEGYCSIMAGRKFLGVELKESYFKQAVLNLKSAEDVKQSELSFALPSTEPETVTEEVLALT